MKLSTIKRRKKQLLGDNPSWVYLENPDREHYKTLCKEERVAIINLIQSNVKGHNNGKHSKTMDAR